MSRFARCRTPLLAAAALALGACDQGRDPLGPTTDLPAPGPIAAAKNAGGGNPAPVRIAFSIGQSTSQIGTVNPDGSDYRMLANSEGGSNPAWSPDRRKLAFTVSTADGGLYTIAANGTKRTRLYQGYAWTASWSPDGTRIAFIASPNSDGMAVMVIGANGRNLRQLTPAGGISRHSPTWSPDGTRILFEVYQNEAQSSLWTINADGTSPTLVLDCATIGAACSSPAWSPAATDQRIVFNVRDGDARSIATIRPDGTDWRTVLYGTTYLGFDLRPAWSPDGSQLVFTSYFNGQHDLFAMNADGTDIRQLTFTPEIESFPAWAR